MFTEDLTEFLDETELADKGTVSGVAVNGIYENPFSDVYGIESETPTFVVSSIDAGIFAHGDIVTIDSDLITDFYLQNSNDYVDDNYIEANSFKVVGIQPDGTGLTSLLLETQI
jgi:hypothetical protein